MYTAALFYILLQNIVILLTGRWKMFPSASSTLEQPSVRRKHLKHGEEFASHSLIWSHTTDEANIGIAAHAPLYCFLFCRSIFPVLC